MVKPTLSGKRPQTTTQALGSNIARWILSAGCGVMVLINGELLSGFITTFSTGELCCNTDSGVFSLIRCRIYRATVTQIKAMVS